MRLKRSLKILASLPRRLMHVQITACYSRRKILHWMLVNGVMHIGGTLRSIVGKK